MRYWIIGLLIMCLIVAGGIFLSSGFAGNNRAINEQGIETPQTNSESSNMTPNTIESLTTAPTTNEKTASSADESVSVAALTCTIKDSGDYVIDLRYKNHDIENRSIIIDPSGVKLDMLPNKTYRYELFLKEKVSILNISVDDGTELQINSPNCTTQGWSGSGSLGLTSPSLIQLDPTTPPVTNPTEPIPVTNPTEPIPPVTNPTEPIPPVTNPTEPIPPVTNPTKPTPPPPVPELSPLVLTLAGISGLLLLSRIRKK